MALQFQHILAGEGVGPGKVQGESFIQHLLGIGEERPVMGIARFQLTLADRRRQVSRQRAGDAHDADAATALGGGDGSDGFTNC